ncbi:MAG: hypothetical protein RJB39_353 [Candidatus Parcubacteria bacterium]|jgi:beta-lactamase class A
MQENIQLSQKIKDIVHNLYPKASQVSVAVIDLQSITPTIAGYNMDDFMYPASIYKVSIAAEILRKNDVGKLKLSDTVDISDINEVDKDLKLFPKNTSRDHRPLLKGGDRVSIDYLLDLMLTRSDNTAANTLMDIAGREDINNYIILPNGWKGSDITRKFLDRLKEEKKYQKSAITVSTTKHLAELFYKIERGVLINVDVSKRLQEYMLKWNRGGRTGLNIPEYISYYRKGGWLEINGYKHNFFKALWRLITNKNVVIRYSNDVGVVTGKNSKYVIAVLSIMKSKFPWTKFPMKELARRIHSLMDAAVLTDLL